MNLCKASRYKKVELYSAGVVFLILSKITPLLSTLSGCSSNILTDFMNHLWLPRNEYINEEKVFRNAPTWLEILKLSKENYSRKRGIQEDKIVFFILIQSNFGNSCGALIVFVVFLVKSDCLLGVNVNIVLRHRTDSNTQPLIS